MDGAVAFRMVVDASDGEVKTGQLGGHGAAQSGSGRSSLDGFLGAVVVVVDVTPLLSDGALKEDTERFPCETGGNESEVIAVVEGEEERGSLAERNDALFVNGFKISEVAVRHVVRDSHFSGDGGGRRLVPYEVIGVAVQDLVKRAFDFGLCFDRLGGVGGGQSHGRRGGGGRVNLGLFGNGLDRIASSRIGCYGGDGIGLCRGVGRGGCGRVYDGGAIGSDGLGIGRD